mgnify:CR=1 FL=1
MVTSSFCIINGDCWASTVILFKRISAILKYTKDILFLNQTKNFLVLNISKNGPHNGFKVQGSIISEVQKAILASDIPKFLYMIALAVDKATKGNPIANQVLGIQNNGDFGVVG